MNSNHSNAATCTRCEGSGTIRAFNHFAHGKCFACGGTGSGTVTLSEVDAAAVEASRIEYARKVAWLADLSSMAPAQVVSRFSALSVDKVWSIRNACAGWNVPGARLAYWAASTVLDAWPSGRAYPVSWVNAE